MSQWKVIVGDSSSELSRTPMINAHVQACLERWRSPRKTRTTWQLSLPPIRMSAPCTIRSPETPGITRRKVIQVEGSRRYTARVWQSPLQPFLYGNHYAALISFSAEETWRAFYFVPSPTSRQYTKAAGKSCNYQIITSLQEVQRCVFLIQKLRPRTAA